MVYDNFNQQNSVKMQIDSPLLAMQEIKLLLVLIALCWNIYVVLNQHSQTAMYFVMMCCEVVVSQMLEDPGKMNNKGF